MLEEFMNVMIDDSMKDTQKEQMDLEVKNIVEGLEMFSGDPKMLTKAYTDVFCNDNVVYLMTRISQNAILGKHFPELYEQNENGESVINCQQNSPYHRYGVFRHILYTMEYVGKDNSKYSKEELKLLKWTMLLHDIGKPFVKTTNSEGKDSFAGHDELSAKMAEEILKRFYFSDEEKKIILTLIKYHDKYLNEGELTQENLSFLAEELENKEDLFELLIEVKLADNKAKNIDVYNKFLTILPKYVNFSKEYFEDTDDLADTLFVEEDLPLEEELIVNKDDNIVVQDDKPRKSNEKKKLNVNDFEEIYERVLNDVDLIYYYSPVIDVVNKKIEAYKIRVEFSSNIDGKQVIELAKEEGRYEKINQLLLTNMVGRGVKEKGGKGVALMPTIDFISFEKYNNKNRIYDIMDKDNIIISFSDYDKSNAVDVNNLCKEIKKKHGKISLAKFNKSSFTLKDLDNVDVDFVEYDIDDDEKRAKELIEFCKDNTKKVIIEGVDNKSKFVKAKNLNASLLQGGYLFKESEIPEVTEFETEEFINKEF